MVHWLYVKKKQKSLLKLNCYIFFYMSIKGSFANSTGIVNFQSLSLTTKWTAKQIDEMTANSLLIKRSMHKVLLSFINQ